MESNQMRDALREAYAILSLLSSLYSETINDLDGDLQERLGEDATDWMKKWGIPIQAGLPTEKKGLIPEAAK